MCDLPTLTKQILDLRDELEWKKYHTPSQIAIALQVELGKLYAQFLWQTDDEILQKVATKVQKHHVVEEQLADALINLLILADMFDIDLAEATWDRIAVLRQKYPVKEYKGKSKVHVQEHE
jgi:NTP pyrophosphatase (non-canonical NTP hydrolase)